MTRLSKTEFRNALERFYDDVAGGAPVDVKWKKKMMDAGTPDLPDDPTPDQIDAWVELMDMLSDKTYAAEMRAHMSTYGQKNSIPPPMPRQLMRPSHGCGLRSKMAWGPSRPWVGRSPPTG